ncbi:MAG: hypothetical protein AAFZ18_27610, partial [Myxococcota bacterium]
LVRAGHVLIPPRLVVVPTLARHQQRWRRLEDETWRDEDVTGTHEGGEAALLAKLMARAEAKSETSEVADPEDPTNKGAPPVGRDDSEVTVQGSQSSAAEGVQQSAGAPESEASMTRLRATTHVVSNEEEG